MVAVCDILGFKNLLRSFPLKEVVEDHLGYFRKRLYHSIYQKEPPNDVPSLDDLIAQKRVGFAWFPDTFLFYSLEETEDDYKNVIETVTWLIFETIFDPHVRIRAGISYGEVYIDQKNQIYLSQAISDAYELQQRQEWCGGALTKIAEAKVPQDVREEPRAPFYLVHYDIPMKPPKTVQIKYKEKDIPEALVHLKHQQYTERLMAINWTMIPQHPRIIPWSRESATPSQSDKRYDIIRKWENTIRFHDKVCKFCKSEDQP